MRPEAEADQDTTPKLPTRVPGLDNLLDGGLPRGRATLLAGRSGTFKSLLSLQIACRAAAHGTRALYVSTEEPQADLLRVAHSFDLGARSCIGDGSLRVIDLGDHSERAVTWTGQFDLGGFLYLVEREVQESSAELVIIDSASALFGAASAAGQLRSHFFQLVQLLRKIGVTALITAEADSDYGDVTRFGMEDFVCDLVLVARNLRDGNRRRRTIEVHKYRTSAHFKGEFPWTLTNDGLSVFPVDAEQRAPKASEERYETGVEGLDAMLGGGMVRDSITLLRGPTGSGKTTLAGMIARASALRGEKVFYYGFEETEPILRRNFRSLGLPLDALVDDGHVKLVCRYPEATSPEDMVIELRDVLDKYDPSLIVLDSISSIEHVTSFEGFRQFVIGLTSSLRRHGRSALLTQSALAEVEVDRGAPYLSTLADAIVLLRYQAEPERLARYIRVLKMRGGAHETGQRPFELGHGGVAVGR